MNNFLKNFILISLLISNLFGTGNSQFKASFLDENKETTFIGTEQNKETNTTSEIQEFDAIFQDFNSNEESVERILEKPVNCLKDSNGFENCPNNAVQCNELIEKSKGLSNLITKEILTNRILENNNWICPENFRELDGNNSQEGKCKKEYSFYKYTCDNKELNDYNIGWKGPILSTGNDCFGSCGEYGCICNEKNPPENNCFRENYGCPFDIEQKCTKMKDSTDTRTNLFEGNIYDLGYSNLINKEIYSKKICSSDFKLENGECIKSPKLICPKDFQVKNNTCVKKITCKNVNGLCFEYPKNNICPTNYLLEKNLCIQPNLSLNNIIKINKEFYEEKQLIKTCPINSIYNKELNLCVEKTNCPIGFIEKNDTCVKEYSYFEYSCPKDFEIKNKGIDCKGVCGPNGCSCNSEIAPENNCYKKYNLNNEELTFELTRIIPVNETSGNVNIKDFDKYHGFSYPDNKIDNIIKIFTEEENSNKLCFEFNNKDIECINVENCSFKGSIQENEKIKELNISDKKIFINNKEDNFIESTCNLNGHVGWKNRIEGITSIKSEKNRIIFYDSFIDKNLGFIEFINNINEEDINEGFKIKNELAYKLLNEGFYSSDYLDGYTYFVSEENLPPFHCNKIKEKYTELEIEYKFETENLRNLLKILSGDNFKYLETNEMTRCIFKIKGDYSFNSNTHLIKEKELKEDYTIYKCSPISCNNNTCQKANCPTGYDGFIHTKYEFIKDEECQNQSCDANKPYSLYCGKSSECNVTEDNILLKDGTCTVAICKEGYFDKTKNKCVKK
jgi:hypothetical protein